MNGEATQDRSVVLAVVLGLVAFALGGLTAVAWLVHDGADAASVAIISTPMGGALGALGAILARTPTTQAAVGAAQATGYQAAVDAVKALDVPVPAVVAPMVPDAAMEPLIPG